ncbi:hypothetical protein NLU13_4559 [Sarocladium strictum]|uniref:Mitochondrial adapter protein MCP1 transmembrane domain-containing protein n=1 Tax=Sarocladium strictum TaxID=5046 RepID=A0AA39GKS9_SARSR|nr:hypothetical protein NLU13_4559 [Sarocladium strictum]
MDSDAHSVNRRGSQETLISLMQLDPAPIETPPASDLDKELPDIPSSGSTMEDGTSTIKPPSTTSAPGLSGSASAGRGSVFYLTRIQRYSSYAFSLFTTLHLANVSILPAITRSVPGSETYLLMTREIYQTSISEPLLVGLPVLAHVGSGIALRLLRKRENQRRYGSATPAMQALHRSRTMEDSTGSLGSSKAWSPWPPLSWIAASGYAFTLFFGAHVFTNRVLPLLVDGDSSNIGLAYVAHGFARHPVVSWAAYLGLLGVGCGHMVWGTFKWLGIAPSTDGWQGRAGLLVDKNTRRQRRRKWVAVQGFSAGLAMAWAIGGLGVVAMGGLSDGWTGKLYDDLFARIWL